MRSHLTLTAGAVTADRLSELDNDPEGFSWIDCHDLDNSMVSFMRHSKKEEDTLVFICQTSPQMVYRSRQ